MQKDTKLIVLDVKPLSVNCAWKGRRFKTPEYKNYERDVLLMLPKVKIPEGNLCINFEFGFSNKLSDLDNPVKCIMDIMQKKYGFNDSRVYELNIKKTIVKKGNEFIKIKVITS